MQPKYLPKTLPLSSSNIKHSKSSQLVTVERYCHVYKDGEMEELVAAAGGLQLLDKGWDSGNHYVRLLAVQK